MISRTELCSQMKVFDVMFSDEHCYVFGFPIYDDLYVGKHLFPENEFYYVIPGDVYVKLITLQRSDTKGLTNNCQEYANKVIVEPIINNDGTYECIGNMREFRGSEMSTIAQAVVRWMKKSKGA